MNPIDDYARAVCAGSIPAGKYHRLACERHVRDRAREATPDFPFRFDLARAERFFRFTEQLKHYKGQWAGKPIVLQPYQRFRLGSVFSWVHVATGLRRFRTSYHEIPRKNGKSLEAAVVMLYLSFYDGEPGAEGYCIATKRDQAKLVFNDCKQLVQSSGLKTRIDVQVANLHRDETASKLEPLGADHDSTDGLNPNAVCADELHAYRDRGLLDVMETATGARLQPHFFKITTAGSDPVSPGGDEHDYACKILDGTLQDETYFAFIAHADAGDDWLDERTWVKANPNWNVSIQPDDMRALATKAQGMPSAAATFQQKRLNLWVNADAPWLSLDGWRKGQSAWTEADMARQPCWIGIDLASKIDLCALACVFPPTADRPTWRLWGRVWTPADTLLERARRDRAPYDVWARSGHLIAAPGTAVSHALVRAEVNRLRKVFQVRQIGFDPWHARELITQLVDEDGFTPEQAIEVPQTFAGMSSACRDFEAEVLAGLWDAAGSPLQAWCASNVVVQRDGKDNMYPVKKRSRGRIDPIMAAIIGRRLVALAVPPPKRRGPSKIWTPSGFKVMETHATV
jgi:phage terminase large subunit-like protein